MEREDSLNTYLINFCGAIEIKAKDKSEAIDKFSSENIQGSVCNVTGLWKVGNKNLKKEVKIYE